MKIKLFLILSLVVTNSFGQSKLYVTPMLSVMRSHIYNKGDIDYAYLDYNPTYSKGTGVLFDYKIKHKWRFIYGLIFQENFQKWSFDNERVKGNIRLGYLKNIFLLRYNILERSKINLYLSAGPSISLLSKVSGAIPMYAPGELNNKPLVPVYVNVIEPGGLYKLIQPEVIFNFGIEFLPLKTLSPFCQLHGYASVFDIEKKESIYYGGGKEGDIIYYSQSGGPITKVFQYNDYTRGATRNYAYGIIIGLRIRLRE